MEGRSESDRGGDEVYSATFGDEERTELKLDDDDSQLRLVGVVAEDMASCPGDLGFDSPLGQIGHSASMGRWAPPFVTLFGVISRV